MLARRRGRTPMLNAATDEVARGELAATLDEICREGARWMLAAALEAEGRHTLPVWLGRSVSTVTVWQSATGHYQPRVTATVTGAIETQAPAPPQ